MKHGRGARKRKRGGEKRGGRDGRERERKKRKKKLRLRGWLVQQTTITDNQPPLYLSIYDANVAIHEVYTYYIFFLIRLII